jgi:hypothetical protein
MSKRGIKMVADILSVMQETRTELLRMASAHASTPDGHVEMALAQVLEVGKDAMVADFMTAAAGNVPGMNGNHKLGGKKK